MALPSVPAVHRDEDRLHWLALRLTPGLGARQGAALLGRFGSPQALFRATEAELEGAGAHPGVARSLASGCAFEEAAAQWERCKQLGIQVIALHDGEYPSLLREIYDPPILLFACGKVELLGSVKVALVGSRRATAYGIAVAERLSRDLAAAGLAVVSGMAKGIDTAAHHGALEAGGATIAVFGCGVDVIYPAENRTLAATIEKRGLLLSEFPLGSPAYPQNFPVRNRVVSGLSSGVVVIEGAQYSGSSITARLALDQNREVFAVPGNITSRMSWGPNLLIKQGAHLVQNAQDVIECLSLGDRLRLVQSAATDDDPGARPAQLNLSALPELQEQLLKYLQVDSPMHLDELLGLCLDASSSEIISALFELELAGRIRQLPGRRYVKVWAERTGG